MRSRRSASASVPRDAHRAAVFGAKRSQPPQHGQRAQAANRRAADVSSARYRACRPDSHACPRRPRRPRRSARSSPRRYCTKSGVTFSRQCGDATSARPSSSSSDRLKRTKSAKCVSASAPRSSCFVEQPHGVDDDRRVAEPVEEVVRIRVVGRRHRRSDDRARDRPHGLPEARALFHDVAGGNARQHRGRGVPVLATEPLLERFRHRSRRLSNEGSRNRAGAAPPALPAPP